MKIKKATEATEKLAFAFQRLIPQLNPMSKVPSQNDLQEVISSKNTTLFIGESEDKIVGTISLVFYIIPTGKKAWIEDVIVDETMRGKGYGKMLMKHAIDFAKSQGIRNINLTSNPSRIAANRMYQELGFQHYETNMYRLDLENMKN